MQIRRGLKGNLPLTALAGEPLLTTDSRELYIGTGDGIRKLSDVVVSVTEPDIEYRSRLWINPETNVVKMYVQDSWEPINSGTISDFGSF